MKSWCQTTMGQMLRVGHGFAFKGEYFSEAGDLVVLTPGNFHERGGFRARPDKDRFYQGKFPDRYLLKRNDLIVAMTEQGEGLLGSSAFIPESGQFLHNQRIGLVHAKPDAADEKFLFYLFNSDYVRQQIRNSSSGAKVRHTSPERIYRVKVLAPDKPTQQKIAAILSAYDELIENNRRRIALLEKLAEEIYREWFVRLRFPGHDKVRVVKGVPQGWERKGLSSLGTFLNGYAFEPSDWGSEGIPIIKIKEMTSGVTSDTPRNSGEQVPAKYHFDDGVIIFSWSATLMVLIWDQGQGLLNQHLFKVDPAPDISKTFLYFSIKFSIPIFESLTTGATMQHIKRKELDFVKVNLPPAGLLKQFDEMVSPILEQKLSLTTANRKLIETRDKFLPRLISGKLSVENLDIQFPPGMAEEMEAIE